MDVTAGQYLIFVVNSLDCSEGSMHATISNFSITTPAVLGLGYSIQAIDQFAPVPGTLVGPGTYSATYTLFINNQPTGQTCTGTFTLNSISNVTNNLVCNDEVNISVDENCRVTLNPDMFLEGGPYGCFDDYQIIVWPFGK
jgi:hypothetical protein